MTMVIYIVYIYTDLYHQYCNTFSIPR